MSSSGQIMSSSSGSSPGQTSSGISPPIPSFYSAPQTSSNVPPTSATNGPTSAEPIPSTSTTPTSSSTSTTPASSPTPTPSVESPATVSYSNVSTPTPTSSTATPATTVVPSSFTSEVETMVPSTDPAGSVVYVTSTVPQVITTSVSSSTSSTSSNNTAIIAGAVAGGVAVVAILALLIFCIRRRSRKNEFDGNFDPDRVVGHSDIGGGTLPHVDLADEVSPFPQSYPNQSSSSMRQLSKPTYMPVPSPFAHSGHPSSEFYPHGAPGPSASNIDAQHQQFTQPGSAPPGVYIPPVNMYGTGPEDWHTPRPGVSPPPSTVSNTTSSTRVTKEREAMARAGQGGLGLATQQEVAEASGDVVVHQDAGRAPIEEPAPPREIPPSYESIQQG